ncbi:MAG: RDD family protein [Ruminococcaceae bacterium]|nr:RDD family protein [Oscillospiraceae bacterium]
MSVIIKRLVAAAIDHYIICFISSFVVLIVTLGEMNISVLSVIAFLFSCLVLFVCKDILLGNASIGKRIMKLKIATDSNSKMGFITALKRTIPCILLPIELLLIITKNQRLGDIWAKTTVVEK